jgi:hypothetical protein
MTTCIPQILKTMRNRVNIQLYSMWPKVLPHVKKSLYNQPKPYFFKTLLTGADPETLLTGGGSVMEQYFQ